MRAWILYLALGFATAFGVNALYPKDAACVWCPTYRCYGPCGFDCVCISGPGSSGGRCYGVQEADDLLEQGWRIVP